MRRTNGATLRLVALLGGLWLAGCGETIDDRDDAGEGGSSTRGDNDGRNDDDNSSDDDSNSSDDDDDNGSSDGAELEERLQRRFAECGLLGDGDLLTLLGEVDGSDTRLACAVECELMLSCEDLELYVCDEDAVSSCEEACFDDLDVECFDELSCDGFADCEDGYDELYCFVCGDDTTLEGSLRCDGFADCDGGDDEADCDYFLCDDGEELPLSSECDLEEDCADGSDEHPGCATLMCGG